MVNRNAARHLALVSSIVLCLLVYIGYRYRFSSSDDAGRSVDAAALASGSQGEPQKTPLMAIGEEPPARTPTIRTAIATPSGPAAGAPPAAKSGGEGLNDISDLLNNLDAASAGQRPGGAPAVSAAPAAPSGSIEESLQAATATSLRPPAGNRSGGGITGLVPDAPAAAPRIVTARPAPDRPAGEGAVPAPPDGGIVPPPPSGESASGTGSINQPPLMPPPPGGGAPAGSNNGGAVRPAAAPVVPPPAPSGVGGGGAAASAMGRPAAPRPGDVPPAGGGTPPPLRPGAAAASDSLRVYVIRAGDTLSSIAARELGSVSLADNIYLLNRDVISDPDRLLAGEKIRLPIRETLTNGSGFPSPAGGSFDRPGGGPPPPGGPLSRPLEGRKMHRVNRGETLSSIAQYYYGSSMEWRVIYEANRNLLANPNQLAVGMELVIPPHTAAPMR